MTTLLDRCDSFHPFGKARFGCYFQSMLGQDGNGMLGIARALGDSEFDRLAGVASGRDDDDVV
jgi:hypothetical protein